MNWKCCVKMKHRVYILTNPQDSADTMTQPFRVSRSRGVTISKKDYGPMRGTNQLKRSLKSNHLRGVFSIRQYPRWHPCYFPNHWIKKPGQRDTAAHKKMYQFPRSFFSSSVFQTLQGKRVYLLYTQPTYTSFCHGHLHNYMSSAWVSNVYYTWFDNDIC